MRIFDSVTDLIGNTPLLRLQRVVPAGAAEVLVKLEFFNPGRSVKDRPALAMIEAAEGRGLPPGSLLLEPTSGNTGIGVAMVAAARGYRAVIMLPENSSRERIDLMRAYGAEVVLTPAESRMPGAIRAAEERATAVPGSLLLGQFQNPANPAAHERSTAPEILAAVAGHLSAFVATAGTGGTLTGTGRGLKAAIPHLLVVAVEPKASPVLSGGAPGNHRIAGMGPGFIPEVLDRSVYDRILQIGDEEAEEMARRLAREEGLLVGPSSGAAVLAALRVAEELGAGERVVTIAPDSGERYLSTGLFD